LQRAVQLALDLVQAAQDQGEAVGAGHDHQSNSERKEEAPTSTSGRGLNWQRTPLVRSCLGEWQEALSLPHPRAEPPLVAQTPSGDLFIGAKDLFVGANRTHRLDTGEHEVNSCERIARICLAPWLWVMGRYQVTIHLNVSDADPPPLKWSDLRYVFDIKEDCNGKEAIQA